MRRISVAVFAALVVAVGGCGSSAPKPAGPLDDALGYFAKDSPFVAAVETNPDGQQIKQVMDLIGRFPGARVLAIRAQNLARLGFVDWSRDIRPQLGNPLVIGLARPAAGSGIGTVTLAAIRVKHPLKVKQLLLRQPGFRGKGKTSGVRIYENAEQKRYAAVDGDVLVAGTDRDILAQALALKRTGNRMRATDFARDLKGLPPGGLVRVSADPRQLIGADPRLRPALDVKWIASLRRAGVVVKARPTGVTADLHLATDPGAIGNADLPLAPRGGPIPLIGTREEIQAGLREPGRLTRLALSVVHAVAAKHVARLKSLQPRSVDLERQLPHHLADLAVLAYDPLAHTFAARVTLHEPADVKSGLAALAPALPDMASQLGFKGLGLATPAEGESFYALAKPNGKTVVFGVVGNSLVAASDPVRAAGLASEPTHFVRGAKGTAVVTMNARELAGNLLARRLHGPAALLAPLAAASLRDLSGWLSNDQSGLDGHFRLTIVK